MTQIPNSIDYKELSFDDIQNICLYDTTYDEEYDYQNPTKISCKYVYTIVENEYEKTNVNTVYFYKIENDSYSDSALFRGTTKYTLQYIYISNDSNVNGEYNTTIYRKIVIENDDPNIQIFQKIH